MSDKKALVVVDLQNDFLWDKRKPMFSYDTKELISSVNMAIASYKENGYDIIYIRQLYPNIITNKWFIGFAIKGTAGADLYDRLEVVSDHIFEKYLPNTYTSAAFREYMNKQGFTEVVLCGVDECGCVGATAKGAVKAGMETYMLKNCIGCRFPQSKRDKMRRKLEEIGVKYI